MNGTSSISRITICRIASRSMALSVKFLVSRFVTTEDLPLSVDTEGLAIFFGRHSSISNSMAGKFSNGIHL